MLKTGSYHNRYFRHQDQRSAVYSWFVGMASACLLMVSSLSTAAPAELTGSAAIADAQLQVFRSVGEDGVVEFNDYGAGELVAIEVLPAASEVDVSIVRDRQRDILEVAQLLSSDRSDRETQRDRAREAQAQFERQELAAFRAADSAYDPARQIGFSPFLSNRFFANGRRRSPPRYVYEPGPDHPSNGLQHPGKGLRHPGKGLRHPGNGLRHPGARPRTPPRPRTP